VCCVFIAAHIVHVCRLVCLVLAIVLTYVELKCSLLLALL